MKLLKSSTLLVLLTLGYFHAATQDNKFAEPDYNKPKLFADLPDKMILNVSAMEILFSVETGNTVKALASTAFPIFGTVVSKSGPQDPNVKTIVLNLTNRPGAFFTFTRTTDEDGMATYRGRIVSRSNGDAFEIIKENGRYFLKKKNLYDLINE